MHTKNGLTSYVTSVEMFEATWTTKITVVTTSHLHLYDPLRRHVKAACLHVLLFSIGPPPIHVFFFLWIPLSHCENWKPIHWFSKQPYFSKVTCIGPLLIYRYFKWINNTCYEIQTELSLIDRKKSPSPLKKLNYIWKSSSTWKHPTRKAY